MKVHVNKDKCVGCRTCELACSFQKSGVFNPEKSNIRIYFDSEGGLDIKIQASCDCSEVERPLCVELCPVGAIETLW